MTRAVAFVVSVLFATLASCGSTQNAPPSDPPLPVEITVVNARSTPIFLQSASSCGEDPVAMFDASGARQAWSVQALSCEEVRQGPCPDFGSCAGPGVWRLEAGARERFTWDGNVVHELPAHDAAEGCPTHCALYAGAVRGPYRFQANAFAQCEGACACAEGSPCGLDGLTGAPTLRAEANLSVGTDRAVELTFR